MRIGFNCLHVVPGQLGGLETFIHGLLEDVGNSASNHDLIIFTSTRFRSEFAKYEGRFQLVALDVEARSAARRIRFEQFDLPKAVVKQRIDVLHSSGYTGPMTKVCKTVMSVHDLNYIEIPRMIRRSHGIVRWAALRVLGPMSMRRADRISTISNHVRHRITQILRIPAERIITVHARPPCDFSKVTANPISLPLSCEGGFLLYVASYLPHKNHAVLFRAISEAKQLGTELPPLVLAGLHLRSHAERRALYETISRFQIQNQVHCVDQHLSLENLAYLYQKAQVFVFPSVFEGFGIPVVEAMSAKVPVVCSAVEPLIEVTADGAIRFSPHDSAELRKHLQAIRESSELREKMIEQGYERYLTLQAEAQLAGKRFVAFYESLSNGSDG